MNIKIMGPGGVTKLSGDFSTNKKPEQDFRKSASNEKKDLRDTKKDSK